MEHDDRLITRAGAGDERAFAELVDRHREPLLRYIGRRFSPDLAEDAVQEALLSAHRALLAGTRPADTRAWLSTIAWRRALDLTRREREALPLDPGVAAAATQEPEARLLQANELGRVVAAFAELPERQQAALRLSALEGRSLEEIGDALDVAPDTAKSLVARSRRTLSHHLAAAELGCDSVRVRMEDSAARGVRLAGDVTLHLRSCRTCARAHREIRRRRRLRVALVIPFGLALKVGRLRDLMAFNPMWEAQASAAKLCTAACLTAVSAGSVAAPAVVVIPRSTPAPLITSLDKPEHKKNKPRKAKRTPTPTPTATVVVARATATATWTPTPVPTVAKRKTAVLPNVAAAAGSGESAPSSTPTPVKTATPTPTPTPTPPPVETPTPTPTG